MSLFKNKTLMITGGTGLFGNIVLKNCLSADISEIRFFRMMTRGGTMCPMSYIGITYYADSN